MTGLPETGPAEAGVEVPTGYALVLPPGWQRIPVVGAGPVITALLDDAFRGLPRDSYAPHRAELQRVLDEQVAAAQAHHGIDLYLPIGGVRGLPVAASFVVSHLPPSEHPPLGVLSALADDGAEPVEVAGAAAVRTRRRVASQPTRQEGLDVDTDRVGYVLAVPGGGWLLLSFSAAVTAAPAGLPKDAVAEVSTLTEVMVQLFDALVTTLRWRYA